MNDAHVMHAATMVLAALIGDDLLGELDCALSDSTLPLSAEASRHDLSFDLLFQASLDWQNQLESLEDAIVPAGERAAQPPHGTT